MKILFVSPEITPFAKTGGLADVAHALPEALKALGNDICAVMPKYLSIAEQNLAMEPVASLTVGAGLVVVDAKDGKELARFPWGGQKSYFINTASPIVSVPSCFFSSCRCSSLEASMPICAMRLPAWYISGSRSLYLTSRSARP